MARMAIVECRSFAHSNPKKTMKLIAKFLIATAAVTVAFAGFAQDKPDAHEAPKTYTPDLTKGEASYNGVCIGCHGAEGNAPTSQFPKLAQQSAEYIVKQLQEFKSGKRANAIMMGMAAPLSDNDMKNIAAWLSSKKSAANNAKNKDTLLVGERIYRGGIADRQIPACAGCHSPNGAGIPAQFPRLGGQHADYTVAQLTAFRDGVRNNAAQMTGVSAKLNDREIKAVSDYIAGLH